MNFQIIKKAVEHNLKAFAEADYLFVSDVSKDELWDTYLSSFPEGTNPLYKERTEHDCNCCKQFVKNVGNVVAIVNGKVKTIWDINVDGPYQAVAEAMGVKVAMAPIKNIFLTPEPKFGADNTKQLTAEGNVLSWDHFYWKVPNKFRSDNAASVKGEMREHYNVLVRSLSEISDEAVEIVLEMIEQDSIYRGVEHLKTVKELSKLKKQFKKATQEDLFCWTNATKLKQGARFRNTVIGTLLTDISEGVELDKAVKSFEAKVAPANYKRTSAVVTKGMIQQAQKKVKELGLMDALTRRHAVADDVSINDVLFADRSVKPRLDAFDELVASAPAKAPASNKIEEVNIEDFIKKILPRIDTMELMLENKHSGNFMSVIAPMDTDGSKLFKWNNDFSWSYNGEVTDSMKERVKAAGGRVDGVLRFTHTWNYDGKNQSLMDLHVFLPGSGIHKDGHHDKYPTGKRVGWNHRKDPHTGGVQDVDYTSAPGKSVPIENITFPDRKKLPNGKYTFKIHNWSFRDVTKSGFQAEIEFDGNLYQYSYDKPLKNKEWVTVAEATYKNGEFTIKHMLPESTQQKEIWGINTNTYQKVNMMMLSPNHWHGEEKGNKHYFFIMDGCKTDESTRGFYNEFLRDELIQHRKVFEVLGSKMRVEPCNDQLSGVGFSSTQRNSVICKVTGSYTRTIKINF